MKITFIGADHEVTGSCTLLQCCGRNILIDCGMEQGVNIYENIDIPISLADIDAVLLTHAHIDHSGKLPYIAANGFRGKIYCTEATRRLSDIMLKDSAHIQEFEAEWRSRKARRAGEAEYVPLYTMTDAENALKLFVGVSYNEMIELYDGIIVRFIDAGHLLGSSSIEIQITENGEKRVIVFSGDIGNTDRPLIKNPTPVSYADYVVIESTYGDRTHGPQPDYVTQLSAIIEETFSRGGNVVIPSFAIGRTQEMLYLLRIIKERGLIKSNPDFSVFVDSPLAREATEVYSSGMTDYYDDQTLELLSKGINPIAFDGLKMAITSEDSKNINFDNSPKVIISASGMCDAGRIRHHLKHNLWRSDSTVLFVGFQAEGTIGRKLIEGEKKIRLFGEDIIVRAKIENLKGVSGHADKNGLLDWMSNIKNVPKRVFVNHGEDTVCDSFASTVNQKFGFNSTAPFSGDVFDLFINEFTQRGIGKKCEKKTLSGLRADTVYARLLASFDRLSSLVKQFRERPNKEKAAFADSINTMCDKYE
ncbi:MAG: MBL fold metallo-hydrolase [Clostridia bacterium]|nr:MBL fold metallo-hydrolase [Clostridia bacterium]